SACRAMAEVSVNITRAMDRTIKCLRTMDPGFHEHTVEVNRLENTADVLLRDSLAAMFDEASDPIEVIKWKEIYETMEIVTDRCEDVANVIEGIILKMALRRAETCSRHSSSSSSSRSSSTSLTA